MAPPRADSRLQTHCSTQSWPLLPAATCEVDHHRASRRERSRLADPDQPADRLVRDAPRRGRWRGLLPPCRRRGERASPPWGSRGTSADCASAKGRPPAGSESCVDRARAIVAGSRRSRWGRDARADMAGRVGDRDPNRDPTLPEGSGNHGKESERVQGTRKRQSAVVRPNPATHVRPACGFDSRHLHQIPRGFSLLSSKS